MQVLFVCSEAFPLIKTGGLADVSGSLPIAINTLPDFEGEIKILIPAYNEVLSKLKSLQTIASLYVLGQPCNLVTGKMSDSELEVITIQNASLYERPGGPYNDVDGMDWQDNALRFGVLSKVASILCGEGSPIPNWRPTLIHCNDWQTGLAPAYIKFSGNTSVRTIMSLHNLAFQGCFDAGWLGKLELPQAHFHMDGYEYHGLISFLKAGIFYANQLSTVSPTYAREIQTEKYGFGLQGLLRLRAKDLTGILNGIDADEWNPATDPTLPKHYSDQSMAGKAIVKETLQKELGLAMDADAPLLGIVSRMTHQKGLDLMPEIMPILISQGCQFAILGSGEKPLEAHFTALSKQFPSQVSATIGYNERLSHNIMAGCDMFIMPSRFEPCGLNQLYGLAYGTPSIVSATGGLADSVCDTNEKSLKDNTATGFVVKNVTSAPLLVTIQRALSCWKDKKIWRKIQANGMKKDVSWASSAELYLNLYRKTLGSER